MEIWTIKQDAMYLHMKRKSKWLYGSKTNDRPRNRPREDLNYPMDRELSEILKKQSDSHTFISQVQVRTIQKQ